MLLALHELSKAENGKRHLDSDRKTNSGRVSVNEWFYTDEVAVAGVVGKFDNHCAPSNSADVCAAGRACQRSSATWR
jgi:hypothetical protein